MADRHNILVEEPSGEISIAHDNAANGIDGQLGQAENQQNPSQLLNVPESRRDSIGSSESHKSEEPEIDISSVSFARLITSV